MLWSREYAIFLDPTSKTEPSRRLSPPPVRSAPLLSRGGPDSREPRRHILGESENEEMTGVAGQDVVLLAVGQQLPVERALLPSCAAVRRAWTQWVLCGLRLPIAAGERAVGAGRAQKRELIRYVPMKCDTLADRVPV